MNKNKKDLVSNDKKTKAARQKVFDAYHRYKVKPTQDNQELLATTKQQLADTYDRINTEVLEKKVIELEKSDAEGRQSKSWKVISQISGRKTVKQGNIKGKSKEERVTNWYNHFKGLLGSPPDIEDEDEVIGQVLQRLEIKCGLFDANEYEKAKHSIKEGKAPGDDEIPPEVLKRCSLDDIILDFCNSLFKGDKPEKFSILKILPVPKKADLGIARIIVE